MSEASLPLPVEVAGMDNRIEIRDAIQNGRVGDAIALVHHIHPELLDDDKYLFFHLQVNRKKIIGFPCFFSRNAP